MWNLLWSNFTYCVVVQILCHPFASPCTHGWNVNGSWYTKRWFRCLCLLRRTREFALILWFCISLAQTPTKIGATNEASLAQHGSRIRVVVGGCWKFLAVAAVAVAVAVAAGAAAASWCCPILACVPLAGDGCPRAAVSHFEFLCTRSHVTTAVWVPVFSSPLWGVL